MPTTVFRRITPIKRDGWSCDLGGGSMKGHTKKKLTALLVRHLSDLHGAPVLICPARRPTERSAIKTYKSGGFPDWWLVEKSFGESCRLGGSWRFKVMLAMLYNYIGLHIDTYKYVYMSYMSVHVYAVYVLGNHGRTDELQIGGRAYSMHIWNLSRVILRLSRSMRDHHLSQQSLRSKEKTEKPFDVHFMQNHINSSNKQKNATPKKQTDGSSWRNQSFVKSLQQSDTKTVLVYVQTSGGSQNKYRSTPTQSKLTALAKAPPNLCLGTFYRLQWLLKLNQFGSPGSSCISWYQEYVSQWTIQSWDGIYLKPLFIISRFHHSKHPAFQSAFSSKALQASCD